MLASFDNRRFFSRVRIVAAAALAFTTLTAESCLGGDDDDDESQVTGSYALTGVAQGNSSLFVNPTTFPEFTSGSNAYKFKSGSLTLNADGSFSVAVTGTQRPTSSSTTTDIAFFGSAGTWTQSGNSITFDPTAAGAANFTGTLQGDGEMRVPVTIAAAGGGSYMLRFTQP